MRATFLLGVAASSVTGLALAAGASPEGTLRLIRDAFLSASLPSAPPRPSPPPVDLHALVGADRGAVSRELGRPNWCEPASDCEHATTWFYVYGRDYSESELGNDVGRVTGGPWLLVVGFASGQVTRVVWQGQR